MAVGSPSTVQKRRSFTVDIKPEAVKYAKHYSNAEAARKFGCDRKRIREWRKDEEKLRRTGEKRKRLEGGGRKVISGELDDAVKQWIDNCRTKRQRVSRRLIIREAQRFASELVRKGELNFGDFKASAGWLRCFMKRHGLTLRRVTTQCQEPPEELTSALVKFVVLIRRRILEMGYPLSEIKAADETAVWIDIAGRTWVKNKGAREVAVQSIGHEKLRITVMLCARANRAKCLPFVFLPRKRVLRDVDQKFKN